MISFHTPYAKVDSSPVLEAIKAESSSGASGYYKLPFDTLALESALAYSTREHFSSITDLVIIGVGGSSLGTRAVYAALGHSCRSATRRVHFLEHTDPFETRRVLESITLKSTHFLLISKSGTTIESISLVKFLITHFDLLSSANKQHLSCITDSGSPLESFAKAQGLECFTIPANVGGRFSVLSLVGLVPLSLLGLDISALLQGARAMMESFFAGKEGHIIDKAAFLAKHHKQYPISVLFSYGSVFSELNRWFVQLWGESLGKSLSQADSSSTQGVGLTPVGLVGSIDQHSFLQLIVQGARDKVVSFLSLSDECDKVDSSKDSGFIVPHCHLAGLESTDFVNGTPFLRLLNLQKQATLETLESLAIPTDSITLESLDEWHIGALVVYFELLTSCTGVLLGVNAYDQPGVEFGKRRLRTYFA
ncbi:glucose-6-phosphate isomerase [Helicobacter zhangjianzhongii]|uniref:glucose-6-phosphate isomerase n=1 Tax=Helicobacter zhangjianzhongii TaxID=2974574 RepID=UPI00255235C5|nr:glucose-6-phosphate isomerase [Helicobacter sp. CPD2-1]MDL0079233.1 glucose-6-phosphate isomerase [Helicobacter sp. CPD2-1]